MQHVPENRMYYAVVYSDWARATNNTARLLLYSREIDPGSLARFPARRFNIVSWWVSAPRAVATSTLSAWSTVLFYVDPVDARYLSAVTNPLLRRDEATDKYLRATGNYVKRYCSALTSVAELRRFKICTFPGYLRFPADVSRESMERTGAIYHSTSAVLRLFCLLKIPAGTCLDYISIFGLTFSPFTFINNTTSAISFLVCFCLNLSIEKN